MWDSQIDDGIQVLWVLLWCGLTRNDESRFRGSGDEGTSSLQFRTAWVWGRAERTRMQVTKDLLLGNNWKEESSTKTGFCLIIFNFTEGLWKQQNFSKYKQHFFVIIFVNIFECVCFGEVDEGKRENHLVKNAADFGLRNVVWKLLFMSFYIFIALSHS